MHRGERRRERNQQGAQRHDRERHDQALAPSDAVDIGAEHEGAERPHQKSRAERGEHQHQTRKLVAVGKERRTDGRGEKAEQEEVEHLEKIAARHPYDGHHLGMPSWTHGARVFVHDPRPYSPAPSAMPGTMGSGSIRS